MPILVGDASLIPPAYDGREQALIKHRLLEAYLEKLIMIIGMGSKSAGAVELCYIDCFSGPWGDSSDAMESTSIAISLKTLAACRQALGIRGVAVRIRALYVEANAKSFARLKTYLTASTPRGIQSECMHGDFVELRQEILKKIGTTAFAFFFIDPKGFSDVGIPTLRPLLERPRSEFLINLMYDHLNRVMSMANWQSAMAELVGEPIGLSGLAPRARERKILGVYRKNLKTCVPSTNSAYPPRAAHVRVMNPDRERPKYHLVYITSHPQGIVKFMKISEGVVRLQSQVRAVKRGAKKERESGTVDMWSSADLVDSNASHVDTDGVDRFWMSYLDEVPRQFDTASFADILELNEWFEADLQASLVRLIKAGRVVNLSADTKRRHTRPLHFEDKGGEQLARATL